MPSFVEILVWFKNFSPLPTAVTNVGRLHDLTSYHIMSTTKQHIKWKKEKEKDEHFAVYQCEK